MELYENPPPVKPDRGTEADPWAFESATREIGEDTVFHPSALGTAALSSPPSSSLPPPPPLLLPPLLPLSLPPSWGPLGSGAFLQGLSQISCDTLYFGIHVHSINCSWLVAFSGACLTFKF